MNRLVIIVSLVVVIITSEEISEELKDKIQEARCEAQCLDQSLQNGTCSSIAQCNCSTDSLIESSGFPLNLDAGPLTEPLLLCRDEYHLGFKWEHTEPLIFVLEYRVENSTWKYFAKTCNSTYLMDNLSPETDYEVRLWAASSAGRVFGPYNSKLVTTAPQNYTPNAVKQLSVIHKPTKGGFASVVTWEPAEDPACFYDYRYGDSGIHQIRKINTLFQTEISNLLYESHYRFRMVSRNGDTKRKSNRNYLDFMTPTCMEMHHTLRKCSPPTPTELTVEEKPAKNGSSESSYDIFINWAKPNRTPDYYIVSLKYNVVLPKANEISRNVSGNETSYVFYDQDVGDFYKVEVIAASEGGNSSIALVGRQISNSFFSSRDLIILGSICGTAVVGLIIFVVLYYRSRFKKPQVQSQNVTSIYYGGKNKEEIPLQDDIKGVKYHFFETPNDEWQLDPKNVDVNELLGQGAFGVVHKGYLKRTDRSEVVAIKMLKGSPTAEDIKEFESEIEIMKSVGPHPHLVSLRGCCTKIDFGPCLVVEFCSKGDLQTYLRAVWEQISSWAPKSDYVLAEHISNVTNKPSPLLDEEKLEPKDLLSFAHQIVLGMEYLSNLRVVHRDLAARNILMSDNRIVKVADFGLSRDLYLEGIYKKAGSGKIPIKWMAVEALSHQQYTTQSDVWSFGVVLWEIVTLGGDPYPTIPVKDLLALLKDGYRMECPKNCAAEIYEIMDKCWKESPRERPTFGELRLVIEKFLETEGDYISLDIR